MLPKFGLLATAALVLAGLGTAVIAQPPSKAWLSGPSTAQDKERARDARERHFRELSEKIANSQFDERQRSDALRERAILFMILEQPQNALVDLNEALRLNPVNARVFQTRGNVYADQGKHAEAIADYDAGAKLEPGNGTFPYLIGIMHAGQQRADLAIADFTAAIELNDTVSTYYFARAEAYLELNNLEPAVSDFTKSIDLGRMIQSDYGRALMDRGRALGKLNKFDLAIADFSELLKGDFGSAYAVRALGLRGYSYEGSGDKLSALADYKKALELNPTETWIVDRIRLLEN